MLNKLHDDHLELREIARELLRYVSRDKPEDIEALTRCRWRFTRTLTAHLALEDKHIYGPLAQDPRPEAVTISRWFRQELGALLGDYGAHVQEWSADAIAADWPGYCRAVRSLLETLDARIRLEEERLYPLLLGQPARRAA